MRGSRPVIDHRWRQNVVRREKWQTRRSLGVSSMFLPWLDVFCDLFLNRRTATLILSCFIKQRSKLVPKKAFHVWNLPIWLERWPLPKMAHTRRETWRNLLFMQISSVTMASKKKLIGSGKSRLWKTWLNCHTSWNENLQRNKSELRNLQYKPYTKCWKFQVRLCHCPKKFQQLQPK